MANLGINLAKGIIKYSQNGGRLLSKTTTGNTRTAIVETNFGKRLKKIIQEFGEDGKLSTLTITTQDKTGKDIGTIIKSYSRNNTQTKIETLEFDKAGNLTSSGTEKQAIIKELDSSKSMLRVKFDQKQGKAKRYEEQAYEYLTNDNNQDLRKNLYTTATRLNNGKVINKTISGNLDNLEEIAKDPYLHIRNYSDADFAQSASYIAAENQGVNRGKLIDKKLKKSCGYYQSLTRKITIDSSKHIFPTKSELVDTLNHEYRHKYQYAQIRKMFGRFLNIFKTDKNKILMTQSELKQAKAFGKANIIYCPPELNYKKYYNNLLEVDARKAGDIAQSAYDNYSYKLAQAFEGEVFGSMFDCHDSGLLRDLEKCKTINVGLFDFGKAAKA